MLTILNTGTWDTTIIMYLYTSSYVFIRLHTSSYVFIRLHTSSYVFIRVHTSSYAFIRLHTSSYVFIRLHTYDSSQFNAISNLQYNRDPLSHLEYVVLTGSYPLWKSLKVFEFWEMISLSVSLLKSEICVLINLRSLKVFEK